MPLGQRSEDAYGESPAFTNRGTCERAILNVGREDVFLHGITPMDTRLSILGASSGYLIVDVTAARDSIAVGDELAFSLSYGAVIAAMTSEYVKKVEAGSHARTENPALRDDS